MPRRYERYDLRLLRPPVDARIEIAPKPVSWGETEEDEDHRSVMEAAERDCRTAQMLVYGIIVILAGAVCALGVIIWALMPHGGR